MGSKSNTPGPGNYVVPNMVGREGRQVSMHKLIKYSTLEKEQHLLPGPSSYDDKTRNVVKREAQYKIGTGPRFDTSEEKQKAFHQDPGNYQPSWSLTTKASKKYGFGTEERKHIVKKDSGLLPGPGNYKVPDKVVTGPKYLFA